MLLNVQAPRRLCVVATAAQQAPGVPQERVMHISSTANQAVKHCVKLRENGRYRAETGTTVVAGRDLVEELGALLVARGGPLRALVALDVEQLPPGIPADRYVTVTPPVMQKIAGLSSVPPGALAAEVPLPRPADLARAAPGALSRLLVLDGVQDPGNLGTLCRTALALGWQAAVLLPGCCDPFNEKAIKASRGAVFKLPLAQMSLEEWQQLVQGHGLLALGAEPDRSPAGSSRAGSSGGSSSSDGSGAGSSTAAAGGAARQQGAQQPASLAELQQQLGSLRVCLCLGAEGQGLSAAVAAQCQPISIPQAGGGTLMESLNVAAAGAVLMAALSPSATQLLSELASL